MPESSTPAPSQPQQAPPPQRRGMLGSAKSMVLSMVAVLAGCAIWLWVVPQSGDQSEPVKNVGSIAREVGSQKKWDVALPHGLAKGWVPVNVRLARYENQPETWHAGYRTPDDDFVSAEQTDRSDQGWVRKQTQGGEPAGSVTVGGVVWTQYTAGEVRSLVRSEPLGELHTLVTGKVDWSVLKTFASTLRPLSKAKS